ncbi:MAG: hypothetical protein AAF978_05270 [Cyanobacteria bacterium P01_E01_bin.48]
MFGDELEQIFEGLAENTNKPGLCALTLELVKIPVVRKSLSSRGIEPTAIEKALEGLPRDDQPVLQRVMSRAVMKVTLKNKRTVEPLDLIEAIVADGSSAAANALVGLGFNADVAGDEAITSELARQQKIRDRLSAFKAKAAQVQGDGPRLKAAINVGNGHTSNANRPREFRVSVTHRGEPIQFKAAVGTGGSLELFIETTPFRYKFRGSTIVVLVEAVSGGELHVSVDKVLEDGSLQGLGSAGGGGGLVTIFHDARLGSSYSG